MEAHWETSRVKIRAVVVGLDLAYRVAPVPIYQITVIAFIDAIEVLIPTHLQTLSCTCWVCKQAWTVLTNTTAAFSQISSCNASLALILSWAIAECTGTVTILTWEKCLIVVQASIAVGKTTRRFIKNIWGVIAWEAFRDRRTKAAGTSGITAHTRLREIISVERIGTLSYTAP